MRASGYNSKISSAQKVVEGLKENVMEIFWEEDPNEFCSSRSLLPLIQEEAEYSIVHLHLKDQDQTYFLQEITQVLGVFGED